MPQRDPSHGGQGASPLSVLKVDLNTGKKTELQTAFNDYGETVRSFAWAPVS